MAAQDDILRELEKLAGGAAWSWRDRFSSETQPRLAQLLIDTAAVQVRKQMGQDTTLAEQALETSMAQIALAEREHVRQAGLDLAFRAVLTLLLRVLPAA